MMGLKRCFVLVGALLLFGLFTTNAKAESTYLGELCWNVVISGETVGTVKLGITHMGGNYFFAQGGSSSDSVYFSGSGLVVGNTIVFSMSGTSTKNHSGTIMKRGESWDVRIDLTTVNGTFWDISTEYNDDGSTYIHYDEGAWVFTSCQ